MRSIFVLVSLVCHFALFTHAQRGGHPEPEPAKGPEPATYDNPSGSTDTNGLDKGDPVGVPGALAEGQNPDLAPEDDEIDFDDIADKLKELIEKIVDAADNAAQSSTTTTTVATITQGPLPTGATPCASALNAYSSCSTAYNGTFSAVTATVQAGCLCNAQVDFDFNGEMGSCYSYAQNQTQYQSYASVIASATAACSCVPQTFLDNDNAGGCTPTASPTTTSSSAAAATSSLQAGSEAGASPSPSGAARNLSACLGAVVVSAALAFMSML